MNTRSLNNTGVLFAISNFKLERGLYLNPDIRRAWTIARDTVAISEGLNNKIERGSKLHEISLKEVESDLHMFKRLTNMHEADVFDALYVAAERYQKSCK
jgi:hypothetical protein